MFIARQATDFHSFLTQRMYSNHESLAAPTFFKRCVPWYIVYDHGNGAAARKTNVLDCHVLYHRQYLECIQVFFY